MQIKSTKPLSQAEAKQILEERKKDSDLDYEQLQALEHAEKFQKTGSDRVKLVSELVKEFTLPLETAIKIVDLSPSKTETLKAILVKDKVELEDAAMEAILKKL